MTQEHIALLVDEKKLSIEELAVSCMVSREWIIERVQAGVLPANAGNDPGEWFFNSLSVLRARRLYGLERDFDANAELAGLVADLLDEVQRLRTRLHRAGISMD